LLYIVKQLIIVTLNNMIMKPEQKKKLQDALIKVLDDKNRIQQCIQNGGKLSDLKDIKFVKPKHI
jgi:hypothetical protein